MAARAGSKRRIGLWFIVALAGAGAFTVYRYRSGATSSGYPLAALAPHALQSELWRVAPDALDRSTVDDYARIAAAAKRIDAAVALAEKESSLLDAARVDDLDADARRRIRDVWASMMDPLVELDTLKRRYEGWFGVDYLKHPSLHARSFALTHAALSTQVAAGQRFLTLVAGKKLAQTLFDEAVPELGIPRGTFSQLRRKLAGTTDQAFVPTGAEWYRLWIARHLTSGAHRAFDALVQDRQARAIAALGPSAVTGNVGNKVELLRTVAYHRWFPVQKEVAEWAGDTRFVSEDRRLIRDAQLEELQKKLRPGDIVFERRNWYLSNAGLPGFWPHAALYVGSPEEIAQAFDGDEDVKKTFGGSFAQHLATKRAAAFRALGEKDERGHPRRILEAVSEGVVVASLEHSCGADYVGALRPRMTNVDIARAIDRAFSFYGRPYDFDFDFATDDAVVCSELVLKAYEAREGYKGMRVPFVITAGRRTVPPTELVRLFANERAMPNPQLDFVAFLDGKEKSKNAEWGDATSFAASATRAKWDLAQQ